MKLTTVTPKNQKATPSSNAFHLKKMMQIAAEAPIEHKSSYRIKDSLKDSQETVHYPKNFHKQPFLTSKTVPSLDESEENK